MLRLDWNLVFTIINLVILYLLMKRFLFKPVQKIIAARQEEANQAFKKAEEAEAQAQQEKEKYEQSMQEIEEAKEKALAEARRAAQAEYQRILDEAAGKAQSVTEEARMLAEHEKERILKSAQKEIADMVVEMTARVVAAKEGAESDKALYDSFISSVQ